jgi:hypothetical protein
MTRPYVMTVSSKTAFPPTTEPVIVTPSPSGSSCPKTPPPMSTSAVTASPSIAMSSMAGPMLEKVRLFQVPV